MKVVQINTVFKRGGSTGKITNEIYEAAREAGLESFVAYGYGSDLRNHSDIYRIESGFELIISKLSTRIFARHGFYNVNETKRLLKWLDLVKPDIIHLHNLHNHYINIEILFNYIKKINDIPVVWTLHDCWSFTGWCAYFDYSGCDKWKTKCKNCPSKHEYPYTWFFLIGVWIILQKRRKCFLVLTS